MQWPTEANSSGTEVSMAMFILINSIYGAAPFYNGSDLIIDYGSSAAIFHYKKGTYHLVLL